MKKHCLYFYHILPAADTKHSAVMPEKTLSNSVAVSAATVSVVNAGVLAAETAEPVVSCYSLWLYLPSACCNIGHSTQNINKVTTIT